MNLDAIKTRLKPIIESEEHPAGRRFNYFIKILIVLTMLAFAIETLPDLSPGARAWLRAFEITSVMIFTAEYLLRVLVADRKLGFVFSFYGIIDLLAIVPFYLALGVDLRSLRFVRMLRLIRMMKLVRYSRALQRLNRALMLAKEEIVLYLLFTLVLLYFSSVGIYYFEHDAQPQVFASVFHSLWWSVTTLTTVGYGDAYPITLGGRIFTFFVLILGLGVVAVPAGLMSSALSTARVLEDDQ